MFFLESSSLFLLCAFRDHDAFNSFFHAFFLLCFVPRLLIFLGLLFCTIGLHMLSLCFSNFHRAFFTELGNREIAHYYALTSSSSHFLCIPSYSYPSRLSASAWQPYKIKSSSASGLTNATNLSIDILYVKVS